eukprot:scpid45908/ scgid0932/ LIM domain kinase 1; KIZ-1
MSVQRLRDPGKQRLTLPTSTSVPLGIDDDIGSRNVRSTSLTNPITNDKEEATRVTDTFSETSTTGLYYVKKNHPPAVLSPSVKRSLDLEDAPDADDCSSLVSPPRTPSFTHGLRWVRRPYHSDQAQLKNSPSSVGGVVRCFTCEDLNVGARSPRLQPKTRGLASMVECSDNNARTIVFRPSDLDFGEVIGRGFFGQVLRVTDRSTGTVMVMKELLRFDNEAQRNFLKEVSLLKSLDHPNVMHFVGIMYRNKKLHLITEYVGGGTVADRLQNKEEELSWLLRVGFASDISTGMDYLHKNKIIHRDLTSNNCLIRLDDTVVVGDFGLAHQEKNRVERSSQLCTAVGSAYWMAPEMMKGLTYDQRADIFSFGIILCEIIGRVSADPDYLPRSLPVSWQQCSFYRRTCFVVF